MAKTYETLITEARELLQDTDADVRRYTDVTLLNILNRGLQDLARMRPDSFYDDFLSNSLNVPEIVLAAPGAGQVIWTDPFSIELQFYAPVVGYVVGVAEIVDDEYTTDSRAALLLAQFRNGVIGL